MTFSVPELVSERLVLRRPLKSDAEAIASLADDWEVAQWMARIPHPYRREDALFFIDHIVPGEPCWGIVDRREGQLLGIVGFTPPTSSAAADFGYWLGRPHWGRGFATEAGDAVLAHAFGAVALPVMRSGFFAGNTRSERVLGKLGFHRTGASRRISVARGETLAHVDMELTREEWRRAPL